MSDTRRRFLQGTAIAGAAGLLPFNAQAGAPNGPQVAEQPKRTEISRYVPLGRTGLKISDISFGSSRLRQGEESLLEFALDRGVNYIDTAESYTGGESERVIGNALRGKRDKVVLASKQFARASSNGEYMMRELEASLKQLRTDHIDIYFNHAVNSTRRLQNDAWFEFAELAKRQGKISFTGLSGHAGYLTEVIEYAVDNNLVDVILAAYNFGQDPAFYERLTKSFDTVAIQPDLPRVLKKAKASA